MTRRSLHAWFLTIAATLLIGGPAAAGGWAEIRVAATDAPVAGQVAEIRFTVWQHGRTPVSWPTASVELRNTATGELIRAAAAPRGGRGHYVATVTFPSSGTYELKVRLRELGTDDVLFPISVRPAVAAGADTGGTLVAGASTAGARERLDALAVALSVALAASAILLVTVVVIRRRDAPLHRRPHREDSSAGG